MTYDPYQQPNPNDPYENPYRVNEVERETGMGSTFLLAALIIAAVGGFIYYGTSGDQPTVASNEMRPPITQQVEPTRNDPIRQTPAETTGAGSSNIEPGDRPAGAPR